MVQLNVKFRSHDDTMKDAIILVFHLRHNGYRIE
jgi:hypothetical protein